MKKTQVIIVSVFGLLVLLVIWTISAMKGKEENQNTVRLSTDNKDVTITDVKAQLERTPLRKQAEGQGGDNPVDIERMRQLIINSEMPPEEEYGRKADTASYILPTQENLDSITRELRKKKKRKQEKKKVEKKEETKEAPEARTRFNTVALHKSSRRNAIRAYVHSDQVVMAGSTLKMRLGEDCLTDDGRRVRKDSPVYGEVRKIDGERVIVEIRTVNVGGNILPFKKEVYSSDAMEGIYVPGNAKAEINKDATAGAVDGTNPQITGGLDMGSQLIAGGVNGDIYMKEFQHHISRIEKSDQQSKRDDSSFHCIHIFPFFFQVNYNRYRADNIYHGKKYDKRTNHLLPIEACEHNSLLFFCKYTLFLCIQTIKKTKRTVRC